MSATKLIWLCAVLLPALLFLADTMCIWPSPRVLGGAAMGLLFFSTLILLVVFAAVIAAPYFLAAGIIRRQQPGQLSQGLSRTGASLCLIVLAILAVRYSDLWRNQAFGRAAEVGDEVVGALARYRNDNAKYPEDLGQLVPDYLPELPYTGLIGYPDFTYRRDFYDIESRPGEYELRINCPSGGINFDRFIYWPSETYPEKIQGNGVEPMGRWAYVHE